MNNKKVGQLYHYTDLSACENILKSQTFRATHYKNLNDSTELKYVKELMKEFLAENTAGKHGGIDHFIEKVIYGRYMEKSYISSFCTHSQHGKYIMENGLLSMWKGSGKSNSRIELLFSMVIF